MALNISALSERNTNRILCLSFSKHRLENKNQQKYLLDKETLSFKTIIKNYPNIKLMGIKQR